MHNKPTGVMRMPKKEGKRGTNISVVAKTLIAQDRISDMKYAKPMVIPNSAPRLLETRK